MGLSLDPVPNLSGMRLSTPALFALGTLALAFPSSAAAQSMPDPILPEGRLRVAVGGLFESAHERGFDAPLPLGSILVRSSAADLFPGTGDLRARVAAALADDASDLPLRLGASVATMTENRTRIPFTAEVGVLPWLTVGATVPLVQTGVEAEFGLVPDSTADLGLNPGLTNLGLVDGFVTSIRTRATEARTLADTRCAAEPGSDGCLAAEQLASDLADADTAFTRLFQASVLFPATGTAAGTALQNRVASLETRLGDQGLGGLADLPLAAGVANEEALGTLLGDLAGPYRYLAGPGPVTGLWELGDVEVHASVRVLEGQRRDSAGAPPALAWRLAAIGGVRLGTAPVRVTNALYLPRGDDGQTDLFGGGFGAVQFGRLALRARALYTKQQAGTVRDRVRSPDEPFAPSASAARLEWDPGDEFEWEVQPAFRLAPSLAVGLVWRYWRHAEDRYTRVDPLPGPPEPTDSPRPQVPVTLDPTVLTLGTERSVQEFGGTLTYRTTVLPGSGGDGFEVFLDVRRAVAGTGDFTRVTTRASFGGRFMWRLWGD